MTILLKNGVTVATQACAMNVTFDDDYLHCELADGRIVSVPIIWYPLLWNATPQNRDIYEITGDGYGIHWPSLDEDLSVKGFLAGANG